MHRPGDTFHLLDLASQAAAVQRHLAGRPPAEKVAWLDAHGKLTALAFKAPGGQQVYAFESLIGRQCLFFIDGDDLVFIADHTTWVVPPQ